MKTNSSASEHPVIGDYHFEPVYFEYSINNFLSEEFRQLDELKQIDKIYHYLLSLIEKSSESCFLLPAVLEYIQKIYAYGVLHGTVHFSHFELWLNHFSGLSLEQNRKVRGKITGKWIPREEFQSLFPLGMGQVFFGTHFVCAHASPDIDTTVASFWGWMDAFSAVVGDGLHLWNIPGGMPPKQITSILETFLGNGSLAILSQGSNALTVRAMDLLDPIKENEIVEGFEKVDLRADYEELCELLESHLKVLVVHYDAKGKELPMGWIHHSQLHKSPMGTVSLRDFSNREETKIPDYLDIISVVDHHRTSLKTNVPSVFLLGDVQSSNVLVAEQAFIIYDRFKDHASYYIHDERQFIEYYCLLVAILDDTDLLTKVTMRDLYCVAELLNRMKSLSVKEKSTVVVFDDIERDANFSQKCSKRLLQNKELYSIYKKIYTVRELEVEESIIACLEGRDLSFFADTKSQGSCARVGQTKIFAANFGILSQTRAALLKKWMEQSSSFYKARPDYDLFIHMVSTIAGAEEMYQGLERNYSHTDELWFWVPASVESIDHLNHFLHGFRTNPELVGNPLQLEFLGIPDKRIEETFLKHLSSHLQEEMVKFDFDGHDLKSIAILRFRAGTINSRKASIAPYIPH